MAESVSSTLRSLTKLYGLQSSYRDVTGRRRSASPEAVLAMLQAFGAPVHSPRDMLAALRERSRTIWEQPVDPVTVTWDGKPATLDLRLPAKLAERSIPFQVQWESGECTKGTLRPDRSRLLASENVEGLRYVLKQVAVPGDTSSSWPLGYHRLGIEVGGRPCHTLVISAPTRGYNGSEGGRKKSWGVFIPPYALHSHRSMGAGDLTDLKALSQRIAQLGAEVVATLPLLAAFFDHPHDPSPYAPASRLFWNEFYVDLTAIPELNQCPKAQALLGSSKFSALRKALRASRLVDYLRQMEIKRRVLQALADSLLRKPSARQEAFRRFIQDHPRVADYAEFRATAERRAAPWQEWPRRLRDGDLRPDDYLEQEKLYHLYAQWVADEQVQALSRQTGQFGNGLYLDLPLGVHPSGYDVWRERESFLTGATGGAPPDSVYTKGQDWGFSPLHPEGLRHTEYRYFIACLRHHMERAGILRIDHVMGLHRLYMIPRGFEPVQGAYVRYRAEELYAILTLESCRHETWLVGENLGTVPDYVNAALARHRIHSMYVVQYELAAQSKPVLRRVPRDSVTSLNTHDMPPFSAYWKGLDLIDRHDLDLLDESRARTERKQRATIRATLCRFLRDEGLALAKTPNLDRLLRACLAFLGSSDSRLVLVNLEDLWLEDHPQNVPDSKDTRPNWRRKARYSLETIGRMAKVLETLRILNQSRRVAASRSRRHRRRAPLNRTQG